MIFYFSMFKLGLECEPCPDDDSWTSIINRGGLLAASTEVKEKVQKINTAFNDYHRDGSLFTGITSMVQFSTLEVNPIKMQTDGKSL